MATKRKTQAEKIAEIKEARRKFKEGIGNRKMTKGEADKLMQTSADMADVAEAFAAVRASIPVTKSGIVDLRSEDERIKNPL